MKGAEAAETGTARPLRYCLLLHDGLGHPLTAVGVKTVGRHLLRLQADATTVRLRLYRGDRFDDAPGLADAQLGQVPGLGALAAGVVKVAS